MKKITINNQSFQLKSSFSEITESEYLQICKFRSSYIAEKATITEFNAMRITIFYLLSDIPLNIFNKIISEQFVDLLPHVDFAALKIPDLKTNLFPVIPSLKMVGPIELMRTCTAEEFTLIDTAFVRASNQKKIDDLALMACFMYRPIRSDLEIFKKTKEWNGDIREPFNSERCKSRLPKFKNIPMEQLVAIFLYFASVRKQRFQILKYLFADTGEKNFMDNRGWAGSMLSLAHSGVFGNFEEQMKTNWFTVMVELDRLSEQNIKSKQELK